MTGEVENSLEMRLRALERENAALQAELGALQAAAPRWQVVFANALDAVVLADSSGRLIDVNPAMCALVGYSREELLGRSIWDLTPSEFVAAGKKLVGEMLETGQVRTEQVLTHKDGQLVTVEALVVANVVPRLHLGMLRDITYRRRADEQLQRTLARLRALTELGRAVAEHVPDLPGVLQTVVQRIAEVVGDGVLLLLLSADGRTLHLEAAHHQQPEHLEALRQLIPAEGFPAAGGLSGQVVSTGQPLLLADVLAESARANIDPSRLRRLEHNAVQSLMIVPLQARGEGLGCLLLLRRRPGPPYNADDQAFVQDLADRASQSIANSRLLKAAQQELRARRQVEHEREQLLADLRLARERLEALSLRLMTVQEAERRALARELHDVVGQALTAIKLNLEGLQRAPEAGPLYGTLGECLAIVQATLQTVRHLTVELRPPMLDDLGLVAALRWYLDRQAQRAGFTGHVTAALAGKRLPPEVETVCFRVAQEAVTNIARHAAARTASIQVREQGGWVELVIEDDGLGFDVRAAREHATAGQSLGLLSIEERVALAGGMLFIHSAAGQGTRVSIRLPVQRRAPARRAAVRRRGAP